MPVSENIHKGDLIEVRPLDKDLSTPRDFGILRGTALDALRTAGSAIFEVQIVVGSVSKVATTLRLNANDVQVSLIFAATVARDR